MGTDGVGDTVEQLGAIDGLRPWLRIDEEVGGVIGVGGDLAAVLLDGVIKGAQLNTGSSRFGLSAPVIVERV